MTWHVLLIGIERYAGARPLSACVNDIDAIQEVLLAHGVPEERIRRYVSPMIPMKQRPDDELATEAALREGMQRIFDELHKAPDDEVGEHRVFIYYSGHGTQRFVKTGPKPEQRYFREAIVPADGGGRFAPLIFDWEINGWLASIAARTKRVTAVFDCCHSGGVMRDPGGRVRKDDPPDGVKDVERPGLALSASARGIAAGRVDDCMVVAACLDHEVAREGGAGGPAGGPEYGELTRALLDELAGRDLKTLRWSEIWQPVVTRVRTRNAYQTPWLSSHQGRLVLCGVPTEGDTGFTVEQLAGFYGIGAGSLSGLSVGDQIAVYPPVQDEKRIPPLGTKEEEQIRVATLRITKVDTSTALAEAIPGKPNKALKVGARGRLLVATGKARLKVKIDHEDAALAERLPQELVDLDPGDPHLTLVGTADGGVELADDVFGPSTAREPHELLKISGKSLARRSDGFDALREAVTQYHAYSAPLRLAAACNDLPRELLKLRLLDAGRLDRLPDNADSVPLPVIDPRADATWDAFYELRLNQGRYVIEVENLNDVSMYVTVFICQNSGSVSRLADKVAVARRSRSRIWPSKTIGQTLAISPPLGLTRSTDRIVAIATNNGAANLDYLITDKKFDRGAPRNVKGVFRGGPGVVVEAPPPPPEVWTAAVAVTRAT